MSKTTIYLLQRVQGFLFVANNAEYQQIIFLMFSSKRSKDMIICIDKASLHVYRNSKIIDNYDAHENFMFAKFNI